MIKKSILYRVTKLNELDKHSPVNLRNQKKPRTKIIHLYIYVNKKSYTKCQYMYVLLFIKSVTNTKHGIQCVYMTKDFLCFGIGHNLIHS